MFAIDLETATPSHFNEAFRKAFPAADAVVQKCVTFFLYAANDAGVKISGRVLKGRKPRSLTPRRKAARPAFAYPPTKEFETPPPQPREALPPSPALPPLEGKKPSEILLTHLDLNEMGDEQQAAVWTLLKYFKARGTVRPSYASSSRILRTFAASSSMLKGLVKRLVPGSSIPLCTMALRV